MNNIQKKAISKMVKILKDNEDLMDRVSQVRESIYEEFIRYLGLTEEQSCDGKECFFPSINVKIDKQATPLPCPDEPESFYDWYRMNLVPLERVFPQVLSKQMETSLLQNLIYLNHSPYFGEEHINNDLADNLLDIYPYNVTNNWFPLDQLEQEFNDSKEVKFDYYSKDFRELRLQVFLRDGEVCAYCKTVPAPGTSLTIDHIKPVSKFPELALDIDNLQVLCWECNQKKSNKY
jgi:hypothetical protein